MGAAWPYLSFVLGAVFAVVLQWISARLAFKKDREKEYWIRMLNSYQDFYQHTTQVVDLLKAEIQIPEHVYWQSLTLARKAAFDASFFDREHPERTRTMQTITLELIRCLCGKDSSVSELRGIEERVESVRLDFQRSVPR
jgi:hypothetical protein